MYPRCLRRPTALLSFLPYAFPFCFRQRSSFCLLRSFHFSFVVVVCVIVAVRFPLCRLVPLPPLPIMFMYHTVCTGAVACALGAAQLHTMCNPLLRHSHVLRLRRCSNKFSAPRSLSAHTCDLNAPRCARLSSSVAWHTWLVIVDVRQVGRLPAFEGATAIPYDAPPSTTTAPV